MTLSVSYDTVILSNPSQGAFDHAPVCNVKELVGGGRALQGHARIRRGWTFTCMADSEAEIWALDALMGQRLVLNINGTLYHGVMICKPFTHQQITPVLWVYTIGFEQELTG